MFLIKFHNQLTTHISIQKLDIYTYIENLKKFCIENSTYQKSKFVIGEHWENVQKQIKQVETEKLTKI